MNYKTRRGFFNAFVRALGAPSSVRRAWWITNALWYAEAKMPDLMPQFSRLMEESAPKTVDDLIPIGNSSPVFCA